MFSPVGYKPIKEIEDYAKSLRIPGFTSADFHRQLSKLSSVSAVSPSGTTMKLPPSVLGVANDGDYLFLNRRTWAVCLDRIRNASPQKYSELRVGQWLLTDKNAETRDPLLEGLVPEQAEILEAFEGHSLVIEEDVASAIIESLNDYSADPKSFAHNRPIEAGEVFHSYEAGLEVYKKQITVWLKEGTPPVAGDRVKWIVERDATGLPGAKRDRARSIKDAADEPEAWKRRGRSRQAR